MFYIFKNQLTRTVFFLFPVFCFLQSCGEVRKQNWSPQDYTVKRGDTLYSIAWRYEKDFRDIAEWNDISASFAIYPGQRLRMAAGPARKKQPQSQQSKGVEISPIIDVEAEPPVPSTAIVSKPRIAAKLNKPEAMVVSKGDTLYSIAKKQGLSPQQISRWNRLKKPYAIHPGQKLRLKPPRHALGSKEQPKKKSLKPAIVSSKARKKTLPKIVKRWNWPVKGRVIKTFSSKDTSRKGIAIAGNRGQSIKAAAAGKIVYSGDGLISYGNLLIIKHSDSYLSAYAHNRKLLVKEGDHVKMGQTIAHMGTTGRGRAQLHFEIRKNGRPVNPLRYLPKKRG